MITGMVRGEDAMLSLTLRGFNGEETVLEMVVDTGFNGSLSLPLRVIEELNLLKRDEAYVVQADGTTVLEDLYTVIVVWDGIERPVPTIASEGDLLVGMELMTGYNLSIDVADGGDVFLRRIGGELAFAPADLESNSELNNG